MSAINTDTDVILEVLNDKLDRDMENIDATNPQGPDVVIDWQLPTTANSYTWYRKYKSGWVEQGGVFKASSSAGGTNTVINLPITMSNEHYTTLIGLGDKNVSNTSVYMWVCSKSTVSFTVISSLADNTVTESGWQVSGMAAE